jgi:putative membrane protein
MYFLARWLINIAALFVVIHMVAGVSADNTGTIVVAALIIGLLNAFLRPVMIAVTLPLSVLTLGFFTLVINAFIFYLAAKFVKGFVVAGFWSAFWASILFSVISFLLNTMLSPGTSFRMNYFRSSGGNKPEYSDVIDVEARVEEDKKAEDELTDKGGRQ